MNIDEKKLQAQKLLEQRIKIKDINELEQTGLFYLEPIVAWYTTRNQCTDSERTLIWTTPVVPYPFEEPIYEDNDSKKLFEGIVPATNSFMIKAYDMKLTAYYINGCISTDDQVYSSLQDFFEKTLKEFLETKEKEVKKI